MFEAAILAISCVLFVNMGLSEAIQNEIRIRIDFLSCPKCLTFWSVLLLTILRQHGIVQCIATSFVFSYAAQWLCLLFDGLAVLYNKIYEHITKENDTQGAGDSDKDKASADAVP